MRMQDYDNQPQTEPVLFPLDSTPTVSGDPRSEPFDMTALPESAGQVVGALDQMSRRIDDLARQLNCLGYFYDDDDGPRAA